MDNVVHYIILRLFPVFQPQILVTMAQVIWAQDVYYNLYFNVSFFSPVKFILSIFLFKVKLRRDFK